MDALRALERRAESFAQRLVAQGGNPINVSLIGPHHAQTAQADRNVMFASLMQQGHRRRLVLKEIRPVWQPPDTLATTGLYFSRTK